MRRLVGLLLCTIACVLMFFMSRELSIGELKLSELGWPFLIFAGVLFLGFLLVTGRFSLALLFFGAAVLLVANILIIGLGMDKGRAIYSEVFFLFSGASVVSCVFIALGSFSIGLRWRRKSLKRVAGKGPAKKHAEDETPVGIVLVPREPEPAAPAAEEPKPAEPAPAKA